MREEVVHRGTASAAPNDAAQKTEGSIQHRRLIRSHAGLEPYTGPWNVYTAAHLLRRTTIGPTRAEIQSAAASSLDLVVAQLFAPRPQPPIPADPIVPGRDWVSLPSADLAQVNYQYDLATKQWWVDLMLRQGLSITEQMVLFWHNFLASQSEVVRDARYMYTQNALFRECALGNIKDLVVRITVDPAMLRYLNGYLNRTPVPDENYARELFELFTIGKGPQVGAGNYTNYTEDDVRAAARVLTGWNVRGYNEPFTVIFNPSHHDPDPKQFSAAFQNTIIQTFKRVDESIDGYAEVQALIDMIFRQRETAKSFCRRLYRWFVYYDIDPSVEANVIEPMTDLLVQNNFEIKPVLDALLRSAHFYDSTNVGSMIKNPVQLVLGAVRSLGLTLPESASQDNAALMRFLLEKMSRQQMDLLDPPNVAGWPPFYQIPDFYQLWVNTTTLGRRGECTDQIIDGFRAFDASLRFSVDVIAYAETMSNPGDPFALVDDVALDLLPSILGASAITQKQREYLLYNVLGLVLHDEYEWTQIWTSAHSDPPDTTAVGQVSSKLKNLLKFVLRMAEAQLT